MLCLVIAVTVVAVGVADLTVAILQYCHIAILPYCHIAILPYCQSNRNLQVGSKTKRNLRCNVYVVLIVYNCSTRYRIVAAHQGTGPGSPPDRVPHCNGSPCPRRALYLLVYSTRYRIVTAGFAPVGHCTC